jgi:hypothetical protein
MGWIGEAPTSANSKPGPASLSQGQRFDTTCRATSDLGGHLSYLDGRLHQARPKVPSAAIPQQGPPGEELQCGASCPAPPGTCKTNKVSGSALSEG